LAIAAAIPSSSSSDMFGTGLGAGGAAGGAAATGSGVVNICWHLGHLTFLPPGTGTGEFNFAWQCTHSIE
jgi:hypothetical protein